MIYLFTTLSIIFSLCMVYLKCKNRDYLIELSIKSMISNLALLSLILAIFIVTNYLLLNEYILSFKDSFNELIRLIG